MMGLLRAATEATNKVQCLCGRPPCALFARAEGPGCACALTLNLGGPENTVLEGNI